MASARMLWYHTGRARDMPAGMGKPAVSDSMHLLRAWLRRWLPRVPRLLPPTPVAATGTVTMLDLSRL